MKRFNYKIQRQPQSGYWHVEIYQNFMGSSYKELSEIFDHKPLVRDLRVKIEKITNGSKFTLTRNRGKILFFN
jgi:hypothetical protein